MNKTSKNSNHIRWNIRSIFIGEKLFLCISHQLSTVLCILSLSKFLILIAYGEMPNFCFSSLVLYEKNSWYCGNSQVKLGILRPRICIWKPDSNLYFNITPWFVPENHKCFLDRNSPEKYVLKKQIAIRHFLVVSIWYHFLPCI